MCLTISTLEGWNAADNDHSCQCRWATVVARGTARTSLLPPLVTVIVSGFEGANKVTVMEYWAAEAGVTPWPAKVEEAEDNLLGLVLNELSLRPAKDMFVGTMRQFVA